MYSWILLNISHRQLYKWSHWISGSFFWNGSFVWMSEQTSSQNESEC